MRGQKSVTLNLETEEGRAIYQTLAGQVDGIIDEMPPGYMDSLGLGYRQLNKLFPRLVYLNMAVRGTWGPYKDKVSKYGQWTLEPFGGCANSFVHNTGFPQDQLPRGKGGDPTRSGVWFADYVAGEQGANTILAALYWRDVLGGTGQFCEVSGAETQMDILDFDISWYGFNGSIKARTGAWDPNLNQYEWNPCRDGYMMIGGQTDRLWYRIGMCIERDFPQFGRLIHEDPILKEMGARNALAMLIKTYTVTTRWLRDINRIEAETEVDGIRNRRRTDSVSSMRSRNSPTSSTVPGSAPSIPITTAPSCSQFPPTTIRCGPRTGSRCWAGRWGLTPMRSCSGTAVSARSRVNELKEKGAI